jgi:hypothetical protein
MPTEFYNLCLYPYLQLLLSLLVPQAIHCPGTASTHLQGAIQGPEEAEPSQGRPKPEADVDQGCRHEAACQELRGAEARPQHAADELGHAIGDGEDGGHGANLGDVDG